MFLTAIDVLWPVARMSVLIVQKTANAELLRGSTVPARPVPCAGGLVPKDAVQPVAVLRTDWGI